MAYPKDLLAIPIIVAGVRTRAIIDTGSEHTLIDTNIADAAHLRHDGNVKGLTWAGSVDVSYSCGVSIEVPGQIRMDTAVGVTDLSPVREGTGDDIGVILGRDILYGLAFYLDRPNDTIVFRASGGIRISGPTTVLNFDDLGKIKANVGGRDLALALDLGSPSAIKVYDKKSLPADVAKYPSRPIRTIDGAGVRSVSLSYDGVPVTIVDYDISADVEAPVASDAKKRDEDGVIGIGLFKGKSFIIDRPAGKIILF